MTRETRRFVRIYYIDLERDYPSVWFDPTRLSTFVRLLALSDAAWPNPALLPAAVRRADLRELAGIGLVTLVDNGRFVVKGYHQERSERAEKARYAVNSRADRPTPVPTDVPTSEPSTVGTSDAHTRVDTGTGSKYSVGEGSGEGLPNLTPEAITFLEGMTARLVSVAGARQLAEYDRQIADHGLPAVIAAYSQTAKHYPGKPTARQIVWSARSVLEPFLDPKAVVVDEVQAEYDRARRAALERTRRQSAEYLAAKAES